MTAADPQHWYERLIPAPLRGIFARSNKSVPMTLEQLELERLKLTPQQMEQVEIVARIRYEEQRMADPVKAAWRYKILTGKQPPEEAEQADDEMTEEQLEAEAFDEGCIYEDEPYTYDERQDSIFRPPLHFSEERGEWVARMYAPPGKTYKVPYVEWTYSELQIALRVSEMLKWKPTQTKKALAVFHVHIDREVNRLQYDDQTPA